MTVPVNLGSNCPSVSFVCVCVCVCVAAAAAEAATSRVMASHACTSKLDRRI